MVYQHHRRYLRLTPGPCHQHQDPSRLDQCRRGLRASLVCGAMLAAMVLSALPQSATQEQGSVVGYQVVDGTIPQPLTDQAGDAERGRRLIFGREAGDCTICHAMPLPQRQFHGTIGPPLDGVGERYSAAELRLRLVDPKRLNPDTIMPAYHRVEGLQRVHQRYRNRPILSAQQIEDVLAYLLTLRLP